VIDEAAMRAKVAALEALPEAEKSARLIEIAVGVATQDDEANYESVLRALPPFIADLLRKCYDVDTGVCDVAASDAILKTLDQSQLAELLGDAWRTMPVDYDDDGTPLTPDDALKREVEACDNDDDLSALVESLMRMQGVTTLEEAAKLKPTRPLWNDGTIRRLEMSDDPRDKKRLDDIYRTQRDNFNNAVTGAFDRLEKGLLDELRHLNADLSH